MSHVPPVAVVPAPAPARVASVDAYRGFVMLLMLAGGTLQLPTVAKALAAPNWQPGSAFGDGWPRDTAERVGRWDGWAFLGWQQDHEPWRGCTLHDLIQPSFMFLVGVALPFSLAGRAARGQPFGRSFLQALWRSALLVLLAVVLSSEPKTGTNWIFTNVLAQIGLGYPFLFLLGHARPVWQWVAAVALVVGYWGLFAAYPLPPADFDWKAVGVSAEFLEKNGLTGFAAHWNMNANPAHDFDRWFLNLFPRREPFVYNRGGYTTLNFFPSLATMTLGLIAGGWLRRPWKPWARAAVYLLVGAALLGAGYALDHEGIAPSVKRIWSPGWVVFSGGWCFVLLGLFHAALDTGGPRGWAFPLVVVGANSIAAYCMPTFLRGIVTDQLNIHVGVDTFASLGKGFDTLVRGAVVLAVFWLVLLWMYRRKLFVRL